MKTVHELTQNELEELRNRLYHQYLDDVFVEGSMIEEVDESDVAFI